LTLKTINFFDGFESGTQPDVKGVIPVKISAYASDAAYVADQSAGDGSIYYNTTLKVIRYYKLSLWQTLKYDISYFGSYVDSTAYAAENSPVAGSVFYDTTLNVVKYYDGLVWQTVVDPATLLAHTSDTSIHFIESNIDHANILNIGDNSHAALDVGLSNYNSHSANGTIHLPAVIGSESQIMSVVSGVPAWSTFSALTNPMNTEGDLIIGAASGTPSRLAIGSLGSLLRSNGTTSSWDSSIHVAADGKVGIGSTPVASTALTVSGTGTTVQRISSTAAAGTTELRMGEEATGDRACNIYMKNANTGGQFQIGILAGSSNNAQLIYSGGGAFALKTVNAASIQFYTSNTFRGQINGSGFLGMGGTVAVYGSVIDARVNTNPAVANQAGTFTIRSWTDIAQAADVGGAISLGGSITATATGTTSFGQISGRKENGTVSNAAGYLSFATTATSGTMAEVMRLTSVGGLVVGSGAGSGYKLEVLGSSGSMIVSTDGQYLSLTGSSNNYIRATGASSTLNLGGITGVNIQVGASYTTRIAVNSDGEINVGCSSVTVRLCLAASSAWSIIARDSTGVTDKFSVAANGSATNATGVFAIYSDIRLKENIINARNYLSDLVRLRVVKYSLKEEQSKTPTMLGFIAQEVEEVFPGLVEEKKITLDGIETETKTLKNSIFIPMLVKAIQELSAKNDEKDLLIASLVARVEALENDKVKI